jgi:hypothetical protein
MKHVAFFLVLGLFLYLTPFVHAQPELDTLTDEFGNSLESEDIEVYHGTRIINGHSTETLPAGTLEFRVEHRFGDIGGEQGGVQTMFGLDNSSDIRLALEYGITDALMVGIGRSKGAANPYKSLVDGFVKYKILSQTNKIPLSIVLLGMGTFSYMKASEDIAQVSYFPEWQHRFAYASQVNISRKFGQRISASLLPTLVHRNYVPADDVNTLFALGAGGRIGITSTFAMLFEYYYAFQDQNVRNLNTNSLSIAFEWVTFGHNFTFYMTNSKGFNETQFIPYTFENWLDGEFRLGFCIGRKFIGQ